MRIRKYSILKIVLVLVPLLWFYFNSDLLSNKQKRLETVEPGNLKTKSNPNLTNQNRVIVEKGGNKDSACPNQIRRPAEQKLRNTWQPIDYLYDDVYIYSAFIEKPVVRIIGAVKPEVKSNLEPFCYLWSDVDNRLVVTHASRLYLSKGYDVSFVTAIFSCILDASKPIPDSVSLVSRKCDQPNNIIKITEQEYTQRQFTVCLSPLSSLYTKAHRLVEWIELNRLLGAEHFIIYTCEASNDVDKVLRYYQNLRIVDVMHWCVPTSRPPDEGSQEFQVFGKIASNNDCLFRLRKRSKLIVLEDPDEIIVPHNYMTWNELLNSVPAAKGDYNFRDVKFCEEWPQNVLPFEKDSNLKPGLSYIFKIQRESNIYLFTEKSEFIIDPKYVDLLDDHKVLKYRKNGGPYHVPPGIAFAHQYIPCGANRGEPRTATNDTTLLKYKGELISATSKAMTEIGFDL